MTFILFLPKIIFKQSKQCYISWDLFISKDRKFNSNWFNQKRKSLRSYYWETHTHTHTHTSSRLICVLTKELKLHLQNSVFSPALIFFLQFFSSSHFSPFLDFVCSESGLKLLAPFILAARSSARKELPHPLPTVSAKVSLWDNDFILKSNAEVMIHLGVTSLIS